MEFLSKLKYYFLGNPIRFITAPLFQYEIEIKYACTIFGSRFSGGWNHIIETLKEYDNNPNINYRDTSLYSFLKFFKPESVTDLIGCNDQNKLPFFMFPWGKINKNLNIEKKSILNSRFCGPSHDEFIEKEFFGIINLYDKLRIEGYKPYKYPNSFIIGTWLTNRLNDSVFMVLGGNHRMAIFSHLGLKRIKVRTHSMLIRKVNEKEINMWTLVKNDTCSKIYANKVFNSFFNENGKHLNEIINKAKLNEQDI